MAKVRIVFSYHGYPMRKADEVVRDNITGDDEWQEHLIGRLEDYGIDATAVEVGKPFPADKKGDWVAVRVPVTVTHTSKRKHRLSEYCNNASDYEEGFYCDSCYWEEVE
jgi:hypothetical protein